ncbi:MAG: NADH:ubiquinone reductase (Na(+)-transporting) subunit C [Cytophagaceae bacterium]|jgi:Na+-transporting NADH:ubiquinone oxidoreductase subunit C|nr:NADH:ubiquinone reductase (Na(+)-transporting) subunit C [Cytophagaceae bacterium]
MNKQGNIYTFIYASALVIVVAALLAFVSQGLRPQQAKNEEIAKKRDILRSINIKTTSDNAEAMFDKIIGASSYIVDSIGNKVDDDAFAVDMAKELRKTAGNRAYPIYEARLESGELKYILQVRGTGLWGPIWGYISLDDNKNTIYGATFGHKGETPGLGAEIDKPAFQQQFQGKQLFDNDGKLASIAINKGKAPETALHEVDAISGGTITSKGVEAMLIDFFAGYENFLKQ